jgi:hypothetical protein
MAETVRSRYKRLFEIRLLHHYWLDEGQTVFDLISDQKKKDTRLLAYDRRPFLSLAPTTATAEALHGWGGIYKDTALGGVVVVPDTATIPAETVFEFVVTGSDPRLPDYTALTLRPQQLAEIYYQPEKKTYRYKENVPVLTNQSGAARGSGVNKALYLSKEFPAPTADDKVESLVKDGDALKQLTSDQPNADLQEIHAQATDLPVFVHQGDIPAIVPPGGLVGAPPKGIQLTKDIPDNVLALIRIAAIRADDGDFSCIDGNGLAKTAAPVFQVRFKNRATYWRYVSKITGAVVSNEAAPLPLTYFGNAGTKQKPSAGLVKAVRSGIRIAQLVSEIFV